MICPECETEYREGFTRCSDCDVELVHDLDEPALDPLTSESSPDLVAALVEELESAGIAYLIQAGTAVPLADGSGEESGAPFPWSARIWVIPARSDDAKAILRDLRARRKQEAGWPAGGAE